MTEIGQELEKTKAKIINHRDWGKKRLAYQVDNQKYGSFILLQFGIEELSKMNEIITNLKIGETFVSNKNNNIQCQTTTKLCKDHYSLNDKNTLGITPEFNGKYFFHHLFSIFKNAGTHNFIVYLNLASDIRANIDANKAIRYSRKDPSEIKRE